MESYQWQPPDSARTDGRLYYLRFDTPTFDGPTSENFDRTYFRAREGGWYCLSPMIKAEKEPVAVLPL